MNRGKKSLLTHKKVLSSIKEKEMDIAEVLENAMQCN
jgi:hypothetical protein